MPPITQQSQPQRQAAAPSPLPPPVAEPLSASTTRFVPETIDAAWRVGKMFYNSGLMPSAFYDLKRYATWELGVSAVCTMILYGAELGLTPMQAIRMMHVIEGRPVLSAAGKVALVKRSPKCVYFRVESESDTHCTCVTVRRGDDGKNGPEKRLTVRLGERGKSAKDEPGAIYVQAGSGPAWKNYPARMLKARCSSWLCDDEYEDVTFGLYSAEEVVDLRDKRTQDTMIESIFDMVAPTPHTPATAPPEEAEPTPEPAADNGAQINAPTVDQWIAEGRRLAAAVASREDEERVRAYVREGEPSYGSEAAGKIKLAIAARAGELAKAGQS